MYMCTQNSCWMVILARSTEYYKSSDVSMAELLKWWAFGSIKIILAQTLLKEKLKK